MKKFIFKVENYEEFKELVDKKDIRISKMIVESIIDKLKINRKNVDLITVIYNSSKEKNSIKCEKKYFLDTLKKNLLLFEKNEMYEECNKLKKVIERLGKTKKLGL